MSELVRQLYGAHWGKVAERVKEFVQSKEEAEALVKELATNRGWRERVAAAKIITVYQLKDLVPNLVATFHEGPECYTCRAFSKMLAETLGAEGISLLEEMKVNCRPDNYGNNMVKVINEVIQSINKA
jgi:hypothetical protein